MTDYTGAFLLDPSQMCLVQLNFDSLKPMKRFCLRVENIDIYTHQFYSQLSILGEGMSGCEVTQKTKMLEREG